MENLSSLFFIIFYFDQQKPMVFMNTTSKVLSSSSEGHSRMRRSGLKLCQGMYRLHTRKSFFTEGVVRNWKRLLMEVVESSSWEVLKKSVDVALGHIV